MSRGTFSQNTSRFEGIFFFNRNPGVIFNNKVKKSACAEGACSGAKS